MSSATGAEVAVIGAGSSGLAVLKALREHGIAVECFERGSDIAGLWRFENDNGLSGAYASLRTNASRLRMQFPSFPMPESYGDFPHHSEMAAYLDTYARTFRLRELIRFRAAVERLETDVGAGWWITLDDGSRRSYRAVVVATGAFWSPRLPTYRGSFDGTVSHSHEYRTPDRYLARVGRRPRVPAVPARSQRPRWRGCTSPVSSTRRAGCSRSSRFRDSGSPPCSPGGSACPRRRG